MQESVWAIGVFWFYVELFRLLFYKYFHGAGIIAHGGRAIAVNVIWWQQSDIINVWFWTLPKCVYK